MPTNQGQDQALKHLKHKMRWAAGAGILLLFIFLYIAPYVRARLSISPSPTNSSTIGGVSTGDATTNSATTSGVTTGSATTSGVTKAAPATAPADGVVFPPDFVHSVHQAGVVTYVNFWAEWCLPCKEELPLFEKWAQQLKAQQPKRQKLQAQQPKSRQQKAQQLKGNKRRIVLLHLDNTEFGYDADKQQRARRMQKQLAPTPIALWAPLFTTGLQKSTKNKGRTKAAAVQRRATPPNTASNTAASLSVTSRSIIQAKNVKSIPLNQLPYHLIINSQGKVAHQWGGAIIDKVDIQAARN